MVEHIDTALRRGPHPSSDAEDAMNEIQNETKDKVANGYSKVIRYGELKKNLLEKLKNPPVVMIPHKSRSYLTILDLSFQLQHRGTLMKSVNLATLKQAPT